MASDVNAAHVPLPAARPHGLWALRYSTAITEIAYEVDGSHSCKAPPVQPCHVLKGHAAEGKHGNVNRPGYQASCLWSEWTAG